VKIFLTAGLVGLVLTAVPALAQTNSLSDTNLQAEAKLSPGALAEKLRTDCIAARRSVCGKIVKILPSGLVVESGYPSLQRLPLSRSWLVPGTVVAQRDTSLVEGREPGTICVGLVYLTDFPKSRLAKPKLYDYVVIEAFPAGQYTYTSVGDIHRTVRHYSAVLEKAVHTNWDATVAELNAAAPHSK